MRILHLSSLYPPDQIGGAEVMVAELAERQVANGHEVAVACISREEQSPVERNGVTVYRTGHGMPFYIMDWPQRTKSERMRYRFAMLTSIYTVKKMSVVIDAFKPDIVNCHSLSEINPRVWPMAKRHGVPLVHTLHDFKSICTKGMMFQNSSICQKRELRCQVIPFPHYICQFSVDAVASVGKDILDRYLSEGFFKHIPDNLRRVIWNPIEGPAVDRTRTRGPNEEIVFGFLGRIEQSKGVETLLSACRKLPPTCWKVLIAGRAIGGMAPYLEMAAGLPVEFIGFSERDSFFNRIDCLIAPPIWAEPFGRTVAESYVRGVPAIGSQIAGIAEQIGPEQKDWLFPPGDASALAEVMIRVIENPTYFLRKTPTMGSVAASVAPQYIAERYLDLYRSVINQSDRALR